MSSKETHIVLDLDGTLIQEISGVIVLRPYVKTFLDWCFTTFTTVNIWTAANDAHLEYICDKHLCIHFIRNSLVIDV